MRCCLLGLAILAVVTVGRSQDGGTRLVRETEALSPEEEKSRLRVPEGFEVQLFAAEPMINKPINLAFDERGRLWVSSTVAYPHAIKRDRWEDAEGTRVRESRDAIKILEDADGDGAADRVTDFADGLNIPTGVLPWHRPEHFDGCIAWSIPNIWYFADTSGDGKCDHREVLFGPLGYEKDTHGMCSSFRLGSDGWVYGTHGFNNSSQFRVREENLPEGISAGDPGTTLDLHSGNVYRFRPDGSRIEIWSWGQVNPFGLAFDRRGNLYSADCHSAPIYQLLQGAHYPSFGKPHGGLGFGPTMMDHQHGSTGICGIAFVDADRWGTRWNDRILIGNVVTSRINQDRIEWRGSTPRAIEEPDFLVSEDPWFRPVDLCLGADGALYVADFYNRIIGHYEVPLDHPGRDRERGRIWRIVRTEGATAAREPAAAESTSATLAMEDLTNESPFVRRAAAASLQNHPRLEAIPALLTCLQDVPAEDTHLRHALRLSLRELLKLPGAFEVLSASSPDADGPEMTGIALSVPGREASRYLQEHLVAGILGDGVDPKAVIKHLGQYADEAQTVELVEWAIDLSDARQGEVFASLYEGRVERDGAIMDPTLTNWALSLANRLHQEEQRHQESIGWGDSRHPDHPQSESPWILQPRKCADGQEAVVISSLATRGREGETRTGRLTSRAFPAPASLSFWICGHRGFPDQAAHQLNRVRLLDTKTGVELKSAFPPRHDVAEPVTWDLSAIQGKSVRLQLVDGDAGKAYAWLGITRIEPAGETVSTDEFRDSRARQEALKQLAIAVAHLAPIWLRDQLLPYLPVRPELPETAVSEDRRRELDELIRTRSESFDGAKADREKGGVLFQTHCAICHQVEGKGGLIGPQLDGIGTRGVARLCEDILDPNRNVDAHFHLHQLTLKDGTETGGFLISETDRTLRLVDVGGKEHRFSRDEIGESRVSPVSLMPAVFGETLTEVEFRDLLGWLLEQ